ncbi:alpha/beta-type small acid-soluble spore protein [Clostridium sp. MT-14]|uniref:Alpha/beta-type small acid-soluble spore protein n=1 Tax=Clostridium aromativorans TaxID=2836848 RepID=A0ABS8N7Q6_9CLOT|nr:MULTISPECIES: alpha/beta-type small acid-soluble spore protein [Clostridium]KAA8677586.1 alpha/beta-type small acid-soluble spore protein [Clostridium sp. HV4-5-A1G]MCC9295828.1 alpha/beta-type small acid-soluble spore protein [Clostridium aromativorans]CAB1246798.1 Small, acid-soluble spore protein 1 [Clostridiaceae bacterium BL-3]
MSNKPLVPEAKERLNKLKMETANQLGIDLNKKYIAGLTSKDAGKSGGTIGGQMVKKMVQSYKNRFK